MTKLIFPVLVLLAVSCNSQKTEPAAETPAAPAEAPAAAPAKHDYGVKWAYSSDFVIGDPAQGDIVVKLWQEFDANTVEQGAPYFADSVSLSMPGYKATLSRDSALAMTKAERSKMTSCNTTFDAIIPAKANDKDESVVCIWGHETTVVKGKEYKREIHEVWGFNKDGKVAWIEQWEKK